MEARFRWRGATVSFVPDVSIPGTVGFQAMGCISAGAADSKPH